MPSLLSLNNLQVSVDGTEVVSGVDLTVNPGEIHAIMGPNGSGKSSLMHGLMGHPRYTISGGSATFLDFDLLEKEPDERARAGLFLAFQYPREIAGVSLRNMLFAAYKSQMEERDPDAKILSPIKFNAFLEETAASLHIDPSFIERDLNKGFSGGEKKKAEVLQMAVLSPRLALLDETDSGLDIDALKVVSEGVNSLRSSEFSAIVVTHYARILQYLKPDHVHIMVSGKIVRSGGSELAEQLEQEGYGGYS